MAARVPPFAPRRQVGITYLAVLWFVAFLGVALAAGAQVWHTTLRRDQEAQLLFVGDQLRQAIGRYYEKTPGAGKPGTNQGKVKKQFPASLDDLVRDPRYPGVMRHLRRLYPDPVTGQAEWGLVQAPAGGIMGVYSLSEARPIKQRGFAARDSAFQDQAGYDQWLFIYRPRGGA